MEQTINHKKNKQNIDRINSIIHEYEAKLDKRVSQVISEMINYTKKVNDPPLLPILKDKKVESMKNVDKPHHKNRNKSTSQYTQLSFLTDTSLEAEVSQLRHTFKEVDSSKIIINQPPRRQVGARSIVKPKFTKRKPDIVPRQIRLNPLHERNAIKAYQLDKGVLSLIEKGKIGKDVNIITAFEKGNPVLLAQRAIFHQGEERFAQLEADKDILIPQGEKDRRKTTEKGIGMVPKERLFDDSWALTMPKQQGDNSKEYRTMQQLKQFKLNTLQLSFKQQIYIKINHYKVVQDSSFKEILSKHIIYKPQILQLLAQITKVMREYNIDIGYVQCNKLLEYVTKTTKITKDQIFNCITGHNKNNKEQNFSSWINIRGKEQRLKFALDKVVSTMKYFTERKKFLKYLSKKKIANHIYGWAVSCWTFKKHKQLIKKRRRVIDQKYAELQTKFKQNFSKINQQKHYEIHLINQDLQGKQDYRDILNIQITKIFNIKNPNKHIILLLPHQLDEQTINYYYKIMQLEEIPNYKQRVWFLEADPKKQFSPHLNLSAILYYNSQVLKKIKKKVRDNLAFFVVSYPRFVNIELSVYLNIPILSGNLYTNLHLEDRTSLQMFEQETLQRYTIQAGAHHNLIGLSDELSEYCESNKRVHKYLVKINGKNKSKGTALLTSPFSSLPQMYSNTALVAQGVDVDQFYHLLNKQGGVLEKYEEGVTFVSVILDIDPEGNVKIEGTFEKISSGFVNIGYMFPQKKIQHKSLVEKSQQVGYKLVQNNHFGTAQLTFVVNEIQQIFLQKVQCYSTHLGSSLYYYKFLSQGETNEAGDYMAKIIDTFQNEGKQQQVVTYEPRCFCYVPFLLHFGLSDRQANAFFQLCRMGGVSFDLENKYGATFILIGSIKSSMGLITTAKDKKGAVKLMLKSLEFIVKQNSHNMSNNTLAEKEIRMRERENIINVKERLQNM